MREDILPHVRGKYFMDASLSKYTWFRVGGPAEVLFKPQDLEDLQYFLRNKPENISAVMLGMGSNVLIRSGGISGVVIKLNRGFSKIRLLDGNLLEVDAGVLDRTVALTAQEFGLEGLEFLAGIPGVMGGALRMNAGAYGLEIKDVLEKADVLDPTGTLHELDVDSLKLSYRRCDLPEDWIFVRAHLKGYPGDKGKIQSRILEIMKTREETQPIRMRTGGSTFANPHGQKAWELIDKAGCRGLTRGGAQMSEKHCNFLINTGDATPEDLEELMEEVELRVFETTGVRLEREIRCLGRKRQHYV